MKRITDMTVGGPVRHLLVFALPLILTNLGQQFYTIVDAAIVGRGVGVQALASVGASDWIYNLILWTLVGFTQAVGTFVARYFGEKNYEAMNKSIASCVILCAVIGGTLTVGGLAAVRPFLRLLNTPGDIFDTAALYCMTLIAGTLVVIAYNMAASVLRALGDGRTPLIAMIIAALLNIGLDLLFVMAFQMGVFGAAFASVLAQLVAAVYCFLTLRRFDIIKLDRQAWKVDWTLMKSLFTFSLPMALGNGVIALGGVVMQSTVNLQGSTFIAGYTTTNKIYGLLECSASSLGNAAATFIGQNYGAGNIARVKQGTRSATAIVLVMAAVVSGVFLLLREPFMWAFLEATEEGAAQAHAIAVNYLTVLAVFLPILYLLNVFRNALQALQISFWAMISGLSELGARVIMSKVIVNLMGSEALFLAEPVAWFTALSFVFWPYVYYHRKLLCRKEPEE